MRCFLGIRVARVDPILRMQSLLDLQGIRKIPEDSLHITFIFFGEVDAAFTTRMCSILGEVTPQTPEIMTSGLIGFPNNRHSTVIALRLNSPGLLDLHSAMSEKIGYSENREYMPHISIARSRKPVNVESMLKKEEFSGVKVSAEKISLFKSDLLPTGAAYTELCSSQFI